MQKFLKYLLISFNKNDLQDKENLEALMEMLRGEIHTKEFDLYNQAEEYRLDERQKKVNKLVKSNLRSPLSLVNLQTEHLWLWGILMIFITSMAKIINFVLRWLTKETNWYGLIPCSKTKM